MILSCCLDKDKGKNLLKARDAIASVPPDGGSSKTHITECKRTAALGMNKTVHTLMHTYTVDLTFALIVERSPVSGTSYPAIAHAPMVVVDDSLKTTENCQKHKNFWIRCAHYSFHSTVRFRCFSSW